LPGKIVGDTFIPLVLFAFIGSFTPGPNNLMVTASGTLFGFRRTVPHILGVLFGFSGMVVAFGLGLGQIFQAYPIIHQWLRIAGAIYLLYLAWRIARAGDLSGGDSAQRPLTFLEAAGFQFLNPKAWTLVLGVIAAFTTPGGNIVAELAVIVAVFAVMIIGTLTVWCFFGVAIRRFLSSPRALRITNLVMAATVALSVVMLFV
jgi:threonine/homoserine/homoserine lactone efflux protein